MFSVVTNTTLHNSGSIKGKIDLKSIIITSQCNYIGDMVTMD